MRTAIVRVSSPPLLPVSEGEQAANTNASERAANKRGVEDNVDLLVIVVRAVARLAKESVELRHQVVDRRLVIQLRCDRRHAT